MQEKYTPQPWMKTTLLLAGAYNVIWGTLVVLFPNVPFEWADMDAPRYVEIWQGVGMIVGVYGVGYAIAAFDPFKHYPIILVGFLGKLFGPIGFLQSAIRGSLPWEAGIVNIFNDLIWWIPFSLILYRVFQNWQIDRHSS